MLFQNLKANHINFENFTHLNRSSFVCVMSSIIKMKTKIFLNFLTVNCYTKFLLQSFFEGLLDRFEQFLILWQFQIGFLSIAKVINGGLCFVRLMQRIFMSEDEHSQYFKSSVEMIELAQTVRHRIDQSGIGKVFSYCQFWQLNWSERPIFAQLQKFVMHEDSLVVIVPQFLSSPLCRIVPMSCDTSMEESHESSVPMIDNSCHVNISLDILRVFCDEVTGENAAERVSAQNNSFYSQFFHEFNDQLRNMVG